MRIRIWVVCALLASFLLPFAQAESGDSNGMAYEEGGNIFIKLDGNATQLTDTGKDTAPVLSPDGRWIAFNREIEGKVKECEGQEIWTCASDQLWIIDLESKSERMLLEPRVEAPEHHDVIENFHDKTFSPDSKTIFASSPSGISRNVPPAFKAIM